jgi:hypothetical protein
MMRDTLAIETAVDSGATIWSTQSTRQLPQYRRILPLLVLGRVINKFLTAQVTMSPTAEMTLMGLIVRLTTTLRAQTSGPRS